MHRFLLFSILFLLIISEVFSQTIPPRESEVIEMSGDAKSVVDLLQQILEASRAQNINQQFRVRTVDGNIILESVDYKPGALEHLNS
ncbi:TonB-dependent receptor [Caenorhabditis elegans]|uniref:TonB-dependent receptor n=1 Tax=Caenorhabditis elegans TaxID=6239 RepID=B3WFW2_CAEEL|nr:TonB-dependent receptor [Caenorhabditis elegans]CAQ76498.2 TonB-dependent receptor [Caenorhabditis elegans]|eukprot:NP_001129913.2 Uncharacterized protein CELE_W07G4.8 [Caenorhabditis elegans]